MFYPLLAYHFFALHTPAVVKSLLQSCVILKDCCTLSACTVHDKVFSNKNKLPGSCRIQLDHKSTMALQLCISVSTAAGHLTLIKYKLEQVAQHIVWKGFEEHMFSKALILCFVMVTRAMIVG